MKILEFLNNDLLNQITEGTVNRHLDDILKNLYNTTKKQCRFQPLAGINDYQGQRGLPQLQCCYFQGKFIEM
jgi:hypothetical protein